MNLLRHPLPTLTAREKQYGTIYLLFEVFLLPVLLQSFNRALAAPLNDALLNFLYFSVNVLAVVLIFGRFLRKNLLRSFRFPKQTLLFALIGFAAYFLCRNAMALLVRAFFSDYVNQNDQQLWLMTAQAPAFMMIGTILLAPVAEEILHRGLVFGALYERSPLRAYVLSALIFASIHILSQIGSASVGYLLLSLIQYLPAGLIFAWCYQRSGSVFTPILIHIANNASVYLLTR